MIALVFLAIMCVISTDVFDIFNIKVFEYFKNQAIIGVKVWHQLTKIICRARQAKPPRPKAKTLFGVVNHYAGT